MTAGFPVINTSPKALMMQSALEIWCGHKKEENDEEEGIF